MKGYGPTDSSGFSGSATFLRLPRVDDLTGVDVAFVGLPFDTAADYRVGARLAPAAIREASWALRPAYNPAQRMSVFERVSVVDFGDAPVVPNDAERSLALMDEALTRVHEADVVPIGLGGDQSVLLAEMRAAARRHGPLALLYFGAHYDLRGERPDGTPSQGAVLGRALAEGLIDAQRSTLLGMRGPVDSAGDADEARRLGFLTVPWQDLAQLGTGMIEGAVERAAGKAFLAFDVNFFDPAFAPGVGAPEVGGPTSAQALALLQGARGLNIVGADVVEVVPAYDHAQLTALAAATVAYEILTLIAAERQPAN